MHHELKTWPAFYEAVSAGRKPFEVRRNDRGFNAGDVLRLREYDPRPLGGYSGRSIDVLVTYVLSGSDFGVRDGFVVMGIAPFVPHHAVNPPGQCLSGSAG